MGTPGKARLLEVHEPRWKSASIWLIFAAAFFLAQALLYWALVAGRWWLAVALVLLLGHLMHAHLIAFHEAAHGTLCPNRWWNDGLGILIGNLGFMSLALYRAAHHTHHSYLSSERDEELWPFVIPGMPRWLRCLAAAAELMFGIIYTPLLFLRTFWRKGSPIRNQPARRRIWAELALIAVFWAVVLAVISWWDAWKFLLVMYALPALLAGQMQTVRKYIEHMGLTGSTVLGSTRSVVPKSPAGRLVAFSLLNVSYHGVHHQYAKMPLTVLPEFTPALTPSDPEELPPFPSYGRALLDMLRSLADPRVGPQWHTSRTGNGMAGKVRLGKAHRASGADQLRRSMAPTAKSL